MQPNTQTQQTLHNKLPIDPDEKILAVYRHHWFAYVASWAATLTAIVALFVIAWFLTTVDSSVGQYRAAILGGAAFLGLIVLVGGFIPAYLRSQEQLVLTDESLLKLLKPTIFSHRVDQVGLQHIADVSVRQDFFGTMLGYGTLTIETPGEQRTGYDFFMTPNPTKAAQEISEMKENFDAALQSGRLESNMPGQAPAAPQIDPQQYAEFLKYQEMVRMQQGQNPPAPQQPNDQSPTQPGQNQ